jgi:PAS domain S-box-containing protein
MILFSHRNKTVPALLLVILAAGVCLAWWTVVRADREMRADLLQQTRNVARMMDFEGVQALAGTADDLRNPEYLRLKDQLAATRSAIPHCRFLYLMGRHADGKLFFLVDSEAVESKDYSPPGQIYEEAPAEYHRVFNTRTDTVVGPKTDRWGTWITGFVPLRGPHENHASSDPESNNPADERSASAARRGAPRAVLAMDIDARDWHRMLARAALPPALLTLANAVLLLAGAALLARRARCGSLPPRWLHHLEPVLAITAGTVLTAFATHLAHQRETSNRKLIFEQLANDHTEAIARMVHTLRSTELESLARFYESDEKVIPAEFQHFTTHLANNPAVQAWEWIPAVPAADRESFEAQIRGATGKDFHIWQRDAQGKPLSASGRAIYYPVSQVAPMTGNEAALGFDLGSDPLRRKALEAAAHSGLSTATAPVTLVQETGNQKGILIYRPVFDAADPPRLRGFVLAVLRMGTLLRNAAPNNPAILELALLHPNAPPETLATDWDAAHPPLAALSVTRPVMAFGKVFAVIAHAGPAFLSLQPASAEWLVAITGLGLTAALAIVISLLRRRREELERLVAERSSELRESEFRMQTITDSAYDAIIMMDANGNISYWNPAAERTLGYTSTEAIGQCLHTLITPPRHRAAHNAAFPLFQKTEQGAAIGKTLDLEATRKDGQEIHVQLALSAIHIDGAWHAVGILRDITAHKQAEDSLRESENRHRSVLAAMAEGIVVQAADGTIIDCNQSAEKILGLSRDQILGRTSVDPRWQAVDVEDRPFAGEQHPAMMSLCSGRASHNVTMGLHLPDGARRWILINAEPMFRSGEATPYAVVTSFADVTERRQAKESLRLTTERLTLAVRAGSVGIWDYDVLHNHLIWDAQMYRLYGITDDQFSGAYEAWQAGLHPDDQQRGHAEIQMAINGEKEFNTEFRVLWPDGGIHNIRAIALVERNSSGQALHMIGTNWDITAHKQAEAALLETNRKLEAATARATEMSTKAERATIAKSDFLANMSHEIRTPMNGVLGMTDLLLDTPLNPEQRHCAETVRTSAQALLSLINDILDFSKIEAGRLDLEIIDFDLLLLCSNLTDLLAPQAGQKGLEFSCDVAPDVPPVINGDPGRLRQILLNLAGNAIKFTPHGKVTVQVSLVSASATAMVLRFTVRDTGIGIPAEKQTQLFQKFSQMDTSTARHYGGTGLGLAISKQLAHLMDGEIGVTSVVGQGSEFWFTACLAPALHALPAAAPPDPPPGNRPHWSGLRVLLAEDNVINQKVALGFLNTLGLQADVAVSGTEAMQALSTIAYDVVLMDMQMPEMDGPEATRLIRAPHSTALNPRIPIIAMTANTTRDAARICLAAGMNDYIAKPISSRSLASALEKWLPQAADG